MDEQLARRIAAAQLSPPANQMSEDERVARLLASEAEGFPESDIEIARVIIG